MQVHKRQPINLARSSYNSLEFQRLILPRISKDASHYIPLHSAYSQRYLSLWGPSPHRHPIRGEMQSLCCPQQSREQALGAFAACFQPGRLHPLKEHLQKPNHFCYQKSLLEFIAEVWRQTDVTYQWFGGYAKFCKWGTTLSVTQLRASK